MRGAACPVCEIGAPMSYFVTCTFDLQKATRTDYQNAYADLEAIGLRKTVVGGSGKDVVAPTTMTMGEFSGVSAASVRDEIRSSVRAAFKARRFSSEIFITVGSNWTWGSAST